MNRKKTGFSLLELSVVLIVVSILISTIVGTAVAIHTARITSARNLTKFSEVRNISGIILWLDAVSDVAFDDSEIYDGDPVPNWYDIKPSHTEPYIAMQTTPANRPTYIKDGIGKLPAVVFDAANNSFLDVSNFAANSNITAFVVGKFTNSGIILEHGINASSNDGFNINSAGTPPITVRRNSVSASAANNATWITPNNDVIIVMRYNGSSLSYKVNSNSFTNIAVSNGPASSSVSQDLYIGARNTGILPISGQIGEIIIYDRPLSDIEVDSVMKYLNKKWGIY